MTNAARLKMTIAVVVSGDYVAPALRFKMNSLARCREIVTETLANPSKRILAVFQQLRPDLVRGERIILTLPEIDAGDNLTFMRKKNLNFKG
jgi:hypothetical protein